MVGFFLYTIWAVMTLQVIAAPSSQIAFNNINRFISNKENNAAFPSSAITGTEDIRPSMFLRPPHTIDLSKYTIGQILNWTLHHPEPHPPSHPSPPPKPHSLPLHKLAWAVNKSEIAKKVYADESLSITLFAPDDAALHHPHKRHHATDDQPDIMGFEVLNHPLRSEDFMSSLDATEDEPSRHEKFVKILNILLKYHTLPKAYSGRELADKATVGTVLNTTKEGGEPFRIRIEPRLLPRPSLSLNVYARTHLEVKAKNGYIHLISAPLLPPLSPLSSLFLFPGAFSTLTTGIQKVELDDTLAPCLHGSCDHDFSLNSDDEAEEKVDDVVYELIEEIIGEHLTLNKEITPEFTIFAPTNFAFKKLGWKINAFLGSPFGRRILKRVLQYHVIPGITFHTDYIHNSTVGIEALHSTKDVELDDELSSIFINGFQDINDFQDLFNSGMIPSTDRPTLFRSIGVLKSDKMKANITHFELPTALAKGTLPVDLITYRLAFGHGPLARRLVLHSSNGKKVPVLFTDGVAWRGAIHVIPNVLVPPHKRCHHKKAEVDDKFDCWTSL